MAEPGDQTRWNAYVMNHSRSTMYHRFEWADIFSSVYKHKSLYLLAEQKGNIVGVLPLIMVNSLFFGRVIVSMPYFGNGGTIADNVEITTHLLEKAIELGEKYRVKHIELRQPGKSYISMPQRTDKVLMKLDLADTPEEQLKMLKPRLRNKVKRAMKVNFTSYPENTPESFFKVYSENMRYLGSPCHSEDLFRIILKTFKENSFVMTIYKGKTPVAGALALIHQDTIEIPCVSSLRNWNRYEANTYLYWSLIQFSINQGLSKFSFGRSPKGSGTHEFKRRWGAVPHELPYNYICINSNWEDYNNHHGEHKGKSRSLATDLWAKLPLSMTRHLGPRILRQLPPIL